MICALAALMTIAASAAPEQEYPTGVSGEATWTLKGDTMYITGQGMLSGVSNADCQPWEYFQDQIRHVVVEEGVTLIGDTIFAHTYNLETVTIADSVTEICEGAFRNCYALKTVKLPANLQTLGNFAFAYCEKLESAELPDTLTKMGGSVFTGCTAMTSVKLPNDLYDVQQMNFDSCMSLTEVTIPAGVGFLRHASFPNCFNLKKVVFEGDRPHTNGDPFYMGPEDLVVYCYSDAKGWDDALFYTYPVVKLERTAEKPVEEKPTDDGNMPANSGEKQQEQKPDEPVSGETEKETPTPPDALPGTEVPAPEQPPSSGNAVDLPAQAEDAVGSVPEPPAEKQPEPELPAEVPPKTAQTESARNTLPVMLGAAAAVLLCCVVFVGIKAKKRK